MSDLAYLWDEVDDDLVNRMMWAITKKINETGHDISGGLLGGEYGYGAHYKNDVFEMRPFYWGDCTCDYEPTVAKWEEENKHDDDCYQTIFHKMHYKDDPSYEYKDGHGWNDKCGCVEIVCAIFKIDPKAPGSYVHCTCMYDIKSTNFLSTIYHADHCEVDKPNFKHYDSGIEIEWYKYIGRNMDYDNDVDGNTFIDMFKECMESIK